MAVFSASFWKFVISLVQAKWLESWSGGMSRSNTVIFISVSGEASGLLSSVGQSDRSQGSPNVRRYAGRTGSACKLLTDWELL